MTDAPSPGSLRRAAENVNAPKGNRQNPADDGPPQGHRRDFDDDVPALDTRPDVIADDAPIPLSKLPDIVLVRFVVSVSPYTAGDVAGVAKDYAIAALRKGWVNLENAGKGKGIPCPRPKSSDDSRRMGNRGAARSGGGAFSNLSDADKEALSDLLSKKIDRQLEEDNKRLRDENDRLHSRLDDLTLQVDEIRAAQKRHADTPPVVAPNKSEPPNTEVTDNGQPAPPKTGKPPKP